MVDKQFLDGFRTALLCMDSFWDNIYLYPNNRLTSDDIKTLRGTMRVWSDSYLNKVLEGDNES